MVAAVFAKGKSDFLESQIDGSNSARGIMPSCFFLFETVFLFVADSANVNKACLWKDDLSEGPLV